MESLRVFAVSVRFASMFWSHELLPAHYSCSLDSSSLRTLGAGRQRIIMFSSPVLSPSILVLDPVCAISQTTRSNPLDPDGFSDVDGNIPKKRRKGSGRDASRIAIPARQLAKCPDRAFGSRPGLISADVLVRDCPREIHRRGHRNQVASD
jgi:hypothetical protein